jgi:hypothetical protein
MKLWIVITKKQCFSLQYLLMLLIDYELMQLIRHGLINLRESVHIS